MCFIIKYCHRDIQPFVFFFFLNQYAVVMSLHVQHNTHSCELDLW